jgi:hypothetical protein
MSLTMPSPPSAADDWASAGEDERVCDASDSPMAAIEKCLDNGLGACLVVDGRRSLGRVGATDRRAPTSCCLSWTPPAT